MVELVVESDRNALRVLAIVAGLGFVMIGVLHPQYLGPRFELVGAGLLVGTIFGQTTLAGVWSALGPMETLRRMLLSLGWLALIVLAYTFNLATERSWSLPEYEIPMLTTLTVCLLGQWGVVQLPLWYLTRWCGWKVQRRDPEAVAAEPQLRQFGIRQLMILTATIAVLLGVGRAVVLYYASQSTKPPEMAVVIFLSVAAVIMTLPLAVAAWLPRHAAAAVAALMVLMAAGTVGEEPVFAVFDRGPGDRRWENMMVFGCINAVMSAWICGAIAALRLSGYGLTIAASPLQSLPADAGQD